MASNKLLSIKPTLLLTIDNLSLCSIERHKNRPNPAHTINTIDSGGRVLVYPKMLPIVSGMVAPWINTIPAQPAISDGSIFILALIIVSNP